MTSFWRGKRVFITGHTGFKGAWLSLWLLHLGAEVTGFSLEPETQPALFEQLKLSSEFNHHHIDDIRDSFRLHTAIQAARPDVVFHLAAQPLVRRSYFQPVTTWETNVMGTINVLEALKKLDQHCAAVLITTDKCYENREWLHGYRESDPLGGYDPYSSSKAGAELAIASWRKSFFHDPHGQVAFASARAGNVIGGGDWAEDRILPDAVRALRRQQPIQVRSPLATRPWQHVLEPLGGYLLLGQRLHEQLSEASVHGSALCSAFNFGPPLDANRTVKALVTSILEYWPGEWLDVSDPSAVHEAKLLNLVADKAHHLLGWQSTWDFSQTVSETVSWYRQANDIESQDYKTLREITLSQIQQYQEDAAWWKFPALTVV